MDNEEKEISRAGKIRTKGRLSDRHGVQSIPGYSLVGEGINLDSP